MTEVGALGLDSTVKSELADRKAISVRDMIGDIESFYLPRLIHSFLTSESARMLDFLAARTLSVFEQVNQRHVVQEKDVKEVVEQETKMRNTNDNQIQKM